MIRIIGDKLRQYDLNRLVELAPKSGLTLESVSFQKNGPEPLVTAHREEDGMIVADIPNILLKAYGTLTVECHLVDADGYHISEKASFTVSKRDMPADYEYVATPVLKLGTGGGASSWNDLTDKPFGETVVGGDTLTWDGNTEGLLCVGGVYYKVSDATPNKTDFANGAIVSEVFDGDPSQYDVAADTVQEVNGLLMLRNYIAIVPAGAVGVDFGGFAFSEPGTYFYHSPDLEKKTYGASLTIPGYTGFPTKAIKPIDKKYLPDDVGGGTKIVVATITEDDSGNLSCDKTSEELSEPYMNGATLRVKYNGMELPLAEALDRYGNGEYWFVFGGVECFASSFRILAVKLKGSVVTKSESVLTAS